MAGTGTGVVEERPPRRPHTTGGGGEGCGASGGQAARRGPASARPKSDEGACLAQVGWRARLPEGSRAARPRAIHARARDDSPEGRYHRAALVAVRERGGMGARGGATPGEPGRRRLSARRRRRGGGPCRWWVARRRCLFIARCGGVDGNAVPTRHGASHHASVNLSRRAECRMAACVDRGIVGTPGQTQNGPSPRGQRAVGRRSC